MKLKPATSHQLDYIFNQIMPSATGTQAFVRTAPPGSQILDLNLDRGGTCVFKEFTVSGWGDLNQRAVGTRVFDPKAGIFKEDLFVYDRARGVVEIYPKGEYERVNPCYKGTHHT